jgi:hypothetical protein
VSTLAEQQAAPSALDLLRARAFGAGSDARLAGLPLSACPHDPLWERALSEAWRRGWWDVDAHWAADALWPHPDLPRVRAAP